MQRKKVVIASALQITDTPRVVKEADALSEIGIDVEVLGAIYSHGAAEEIQRLLEGRTWVHTPVLDWTSKKFESKCHRTWLRVSARAAREARRLLGVEHPLQLGQATLMLAHAAMSREADLYSLHIDQALWAGRILARHGLPFRVDFEDWYSEDGLPADRGMRPVKLMKQLERELLNRAVHTTTTSLAMARALVDEYDCPLPEVVHNSFLTEERNQVDGLRLDRRFTEIPSITWFSQTIGPGRGLEVLMEAMALLNHPVELHLRGTPRPGYVEHLLSHLNPEKRIRVYHHARVPQSKLLSRLLEHDVGYCGELSYCRSRDLTITNKVFEYMRAGLAIVASDTSGQQEVAAKSPEAIYLFQQDSPVALASVLRPLLSDPQLLQKARNASLTAFDEQFSWEHSKKVLQTQVSRYFDSQ
jgi:glycosyltransferase involved in cell wall biosynthesis